MKHLFLPLPIDTVRRAWDEWRDVHSTGEAVSLVEVEGGCYIVTSSRPPRVFVDLLKAFMERQSGPIATAR
jgi:hypothetical protein